MSIPDTLYKKLFTKSKTDTPELYEETTYIDLYVKAMTEMLTPGKLYRITDYSTVVNSLTTGIASVGHNFDIIVLATSVGSFSEDAIAIRHSGDEYFENCTLSAWELKYDFWGRRNLPWVGDTPNINFIFSLGSGSTVNPIFQGTVVDAQTEEKYFKFEDNSVFYYIPVTNDLTSAKTAYSAVGTEESREEIRIQSVAYEFDSNDNNMGIIYHMKDEFGNEADYDFKNIVYVGSKLNEITNELNFSGPVFESTFLYYTFSDVNKNGIASDATVVMDHLIVQNVKIETGSQVFDVSSSTGLPTIVFSNMLQNGMQVENVQVSNCFGLIFMGDTQESTFKSTTYGYFSRIRNCTFTDSGSIKVLTYMQGCTINESRFVTVDIHTHTVPNMDVGIYGWNFNYAIHADLSDYVPPMIGTDPDAENWKVSVFRSNNNRLYVYKENFSGNAYIAYIGVYWDGDSWETIQSGQLS